MLRTDPSSYQPKMLFLTCSTIGAVLARTMHITYGVTKAEEGGPLIPVPAAASTAASFAEEAKWSASWLWWARSMRRPSMNHHSGSMSTQQ